VLLDGGRLEGPGGDEEIEVFEVHAVHVHLCGSADNVRGAQELALGCPVPLSEADPPLGLGGVAWECDPERGAESGREIETERWNRNLSDAA
jgi:hypothetical protein